MSTVPPPPPSISSMGFSTPTDPPTTDRPKRSSEIKLISHSTLFYWWPVWALCFLMAAVTWMEGNRMAVVPSGSEVAWSENSHTATITLPDNTKPTNSLTNAWGVSDSNRNLGPSGKYPAFKPRMSEKSWPGAVFVVGLLITIVVTNVPLRGLWSFLVIISVVVVALLLALLDQWDRIFEMLGNLHIHMNMAAYMTIGLIVLTIWTLATFVFDRRSYVIFTPGQIKVCEHIGASVQAYSTTGVNLEKQRDDLFRHYIFGLGSGDLILKMSTGDRREIRMPNVLFLGWRLSRVEDILRSIATT